MSGEPDMNSVNRARASVRESVLRYGAMGVMWAFENELFADPNPKHFATFQDFAEMIAKSR